MDIIYVIISLRLGDIVEYGALVELNELTLCVRIVVSERNKHLW